MPSRHAVLAAAVVAAFSAHAVSAATTPASAASLADCTSRFVALSDAGKLDGVTWGAFRATVCGLPIAPAKPLAAVAAVPPALPPAAAPLAPAGPKVAPGPSLKVMARKFGKKPATACPIQKRTQNSRVPLLGKKRGVCG